MRIGPKYKIARRLGAPVFEKTQTQKFSMRAERKHSKSKPKAKSEYALGMLEKQKARMSYGVPGRQFTNYVKKAIAKKGDSPELLIRSLESRLDNVVLRAGFAPTRRAARQMVSHGHITWNGTITTIPSCQVKPGDEIGIREGSKSKPLFVKLDERLKTVRLPAWLKLNFDKKIITVDGVPTAARNELLFDAGVVIGFFSR
jgi:small subunit ribosomal protein S4